MWTNAAGVAVFCPSYISKKNRIIATAFSQIRSKHRSTTSIRILVALPRRYGAFVTAASLLDPEHSNASQKLQMFCFLEEQEANHRRARIQLARREDVVRKFPEIAGVGWVRAITFFVYVDTPTAFVPSLRCGDTAGSARKECTVAKDRCVHSWII